MTIVSVPKKRTIVKLTKMEKNNVTYKGGKRVMAREYVTIPAMFKFSHQ